MVYGQVGVVLGVVQDRCRGLLCGWSRPPRLIRHAIDGSSRGGFDANGPIAHWAGLVLVNYFETGPNGST